jgi:hypothetical protein
VRDRGVGCVEGVWTGSGSAVRVVAAYPKKRWHSCPAGIAAAKRLHRPRLRTRYPP